jgi:membrane-associated protease RseP (regulator of RpoE activity)
VTADCPAPRPGAAARGLRGAAAGLLLGASAGGAAALATARPVPAVPPPATAAADGLDLTPRVEREALRSSALEEPPEETEGTEEREVALLGKPAAPLFPPASADLARGIRRTGPREWTIDPALVEAALLRLELWGVRPIPHEANGRVQSVRLYGIRPKSPLGRLGFQNGDGVVAVNGVPVEDLAAAVRLLAPLRRTDVLRVRLERRGEERVHVYRSRVVAQEGAGSASGSGDGGAASSSRVSFQSSRRP